MLAVIEALRVLLDDQVINERLSIAMLIDRRILLAVVSDGVYRLISSLLLFEST